MIKPIAAIKSNIGKATKKTLSPHHLKINDDSVNRVVILKAPVSKANSNIGKNRRTPISTEPSIGL